MRRAQREGLHDRFCANRSVATGAVFVAGCAWVLVGFWMAWVRPHPLDSGAISHVYDAVVIFGIGLGFREFKCVRERIVIALWLPTPARELFFTAVPSLAVWSRFAYRVDLAASVIALAISMSMLISAMRHGARGSSDARHCS